MKHSKLLKFLFATALPMFALADEGGGGAAEVEDRGDTLAAAAPALADEPIVDPLKVDDEEEETEAEAEAKGEEGKPKKDSRIPLARHKEMMEKGRAERDALAAELARYKQGQQVVQTNEAIEQTETQLIALETEYNKLLAEGEIEKATAKMSEIRRLERTVNDQKSEIKAQEAEIRAVERVRYDTVVERIEAAFPQLDRGHEDYDAEQETEVVDLMQAYQLKGMTPTAALQKAVKILLGAEGGKQERATGVTPNVDKADVAKLRKQETLKRNIEAAKATPGSLAKVGMNNDNNGLVSAEAAMKMSQTDFAKLDEKELAKLRGDIL